MEYPVASTLSGRYLSRTAFLGAEARKPQDSTKLYPEAWVGTLRKAIWCTRFFTC